MTRNVIPGHTIATMPPATSRIPSTTAQPREPPRRPPEMISTSPSKIRNAPTMIAIVVAPAATLKSITMPKPRKMTPTTSTTHHTLATSPTASVSVRSSRSMPMLVPLGLPAAA